jgi:hypothetical protein
MVMDGICLQKLVIRSCEPYHYRVSLMLDYMYIGSTEILSGTGLKDLQTLFPVDLLSPAVLYQAWKVEKI